MIRDGVAALKRVQHPPLHDLGNSWNTRKINRKGLLDPYMGAIYI